MTGIIVGVHIRWLSRRAVFLHIGFLLFVPFCIAATWWQITRAEDGNGLSYLYTFEWPVFAIVGAYFWWMFLHTDYDKVGLRGMQSQVAASESNDSQGQGAPIAPVQVRDDEDTELAAYNARLAALANNASKTWRKPEEHVARWLQ